MSEYFVSEKESIIKRIDEIMYQKNLSQAKVSARLGYSKSQINRILGGSANLTLDFIFSFAREYCHNDIAYLMTGVSGLTDSFTQKLFDGVPQDKQMKLSSDLLAIAKILKNNSKG